MHGGQRGKFMTKVLRAIGFMSGTSMDGVDITLIESDGERVARRGEGFLREYTNAERKLIEEAVTEARGLTDRSARPQALARAEEVVTRAHIDAVATYLEANDLGPGDIDVAGFHGQTVLHKPEAALTIQLGDSFLLARETGIDVVYDMRANDMVHGGQGAPLVPVYHRALARDAGLELPVAIVNVGGVANVTWIGADGEMVAFDTGPGNAMLDDWVASKTQNRMDEGGRLGGKGQVSAEALAELLSSPYFYQNPPKSLDRNNFSLSPVAALSLEDGAATLTRFTADALAGAARHMPEAPLQWVICGGGARNPGMMEAFRSRLSGNVITADDLGWSGAFLEAEAFGFLAVRSLKGLPLTFPGTTGVPAPTTGGVLARANA